MLKIFWEEATKRKSRIVSIIFFPLILSASIDTYEAMYGRCINENNIS